jgi:hypothetical protein
MARGGHRTVSLATKAKIAASLRGNKNAYRGGPKKRTSGNKLTARQKVANINARTNQKKLQLNDAQIKQRQAVAKRLRARARAEEAGIKPEHSKPIPSPTTVTKEDSKIRADTARAHGSIAKAETSSAGKNSRVVNPEEMAATAAKNARNYVTMHGTDGARKKYQQLASRKNPGRQVRTDMLALDKAISETHAARANDRRGGMSTNQTIKRDQVQNQKIADAASKRVAKANNGGGNFAKSENKPTPRQSSRQEIEDAIRGLDEVIDSKNKQYLRANAKGNKKGSDQLKNELLSLTSSKNDLFKKLNPTKRADRSDPAKQDDPLAKHKAGMKLGSDETSVRNAYNKVATRRQEFVPLFKVRPHLGGSKNEQDATIVAMHRAGKLHLSPESSTERNSKNYVDSSILVGREVSHLIAFDDD